MMSSKYSPALVAGFASAVLTVVPGIRNFACCLVVPAAAVAALYFDQKINKFSEPVATSDAFKFGIFTGLFAAGFGTLFDVIVTYILHTNDLVRSLPEIERMLNDNFSFAGAFDESMQILRNAAHSIRETGFSSVYTILMLINNFIVYTIFGMIGGLIGKPFLNSKYHKN